MGPPGSGKSTLARRLGAKAGLPVVHLDQHYWQSGWVANPREVLADVIARTVEADHWVIDGNYTATLTPRLARADTVIYLDCPAVVSLWRVLRRAISQIGTVRSDMPEGCPERLDIGFFWFALNWNRRNRARNLALLERFSGTVIVLPSARQVARFEEGVAGPAPPGSAVSPE